MSSNRNDKLPNPSNRAPINNHLPTCPLRPVPINNNLPTCPLRPVPIKNHLPTCTSNENDIHVNIKSPIQKARYYDQTVQEGQNPNSFRVPVCVLCDRLIIGCEEVRTLSAKTLLTQSSRISVKSYEEFHEVRLKEDLVLQYQISGLEGLLLSPRARQTTSADGDVCYDACSNCAQSWAATECNAPPKHAIANGFAIGSVPESIVPNKDISEEMCALLSPVRAYGYVFAYSAGAHRAIRGHFSFFEVDLNHTGSVMNHFLKTGANPLVYVVLCGRMTPTQRRIVKERVQLNTEQLTKLLGWFACKSGHPGYNGVTPPAKCPQPTILMDEETKNNTDEEQDATIERSFAGATFHFASSHEPQEDTGVYENNQKFVKAMLDRTIPTLLVNGSNYANLRELRIENICPLQFPFGHGGPKGSRRNNISQAECFRLYCRLSLPQFFRGDFLLILNHMFNRLQSFNTAMVICRSNNFGQTLAEKVSTIKRKDLSKAIIQCETGQKITGPAGECIRTVTASCKSVGYCAANAALNRRRHFAMDNYYGGHSIFLTTTPCDEITFRVRVFANAGTEQTLPNLRDWEDEQHMEQCFADFNLRKSIRIRYPGACSLVYQHLMQIVTECLIGWDVASETAYDGGGVFGIPIAFSRTDEEQGRKTLHSHWQIWIKDFGKCRDKLFDSDKNNRNSARKALIAYVNSVICASYSSDFVVTHNCGKDTKQERSITKPMSQILHEVEDKQVLRKAQHQDHCLDVKGKVLCCIECGKLFSAAECISMGVNHLRKNQKLECVPLSQLKEWLQHTVIRYPYDFDEEGRPTEALKQQLLTTEGGGGGAHSHLNHEWLHDMTLRRDLLHFLFDEHDYAHRATCFKCGKAECRANLPEMASENTIIFDNEAVIRMKQVFKDNANVIHDLKHNNILWHKLCGKVEPKSQYTILPERRNGSQYLNPHNLAISDFLGCNTNVTMGDPSHTYYTTLYKSKDTQAEDKMAYHRINAALGRRLWRQYLLLQQLKQKQQEQEEQQGVQQKQEQQECGLQQELNEDEEACHLEGLGRVMTGINALLSRDVVSATMAHLLISQKGERFTYSKGFSHLLLTQIEATLEEKGGTDFRFRRNWDKVSKKKITWPDCSANDYIYRPKELEHMCLYEFTMKYEKEYKTFKEMSMESNIIETEDSQFSTSSLRSHSHIQTTKSSSDTTDNPTASNLTQQFQHQDDGSNKHDDDEVGAQLHNLTVDELKTKLRERCLKVSGKKKELIDRLLGREITRKKGGEKQLCQAFKFDHGHPGREYCHLKQRKLSVIPIISMATGSLCNIKLLQVLNNSPSSSTKLFRERYAKTALLLFYPFRKLNNSPLLFKSSYWEKFVSVQGLKEYDPKIDLETLSLKKPTFWNRGRMILENIQTRTIAESEMKRPEHRIKHLTETPKSTGQRKNTNVDEEDNFDMDIGELQDNMASNDNDNQTDILAAAPLNDHDSRSHTCLIKRANINDELITTQFDNNNNNIMNSSVNNNNNKEASTILDTSPDTQRIIYSLAKTQDENKTPSLLCMPNTCRNKYETMLTIIQGSLLVGGIDHDENDEEIDFVNDDSTKPSVGNQEDRIPRLSEFANGRGRGSKKLDDKQYAAYQIVCCTFLLQLVNEGYNAATKLGRALHGATFQPMSEEGTKTKCDLIEDLKARGAKEQLVMFLSGGAGCGKSTTLQLAQQFAHKFCMSIAAAFNDYTFYFTATTGSAAALFNGTTIHSAAHLNKKRLTDDMRAIWREDVRILIIDEISFFKTSDVKRLDKQLKKLTGRHDVAYGGISIVFSGDFHQLKPICGEDEVLYSNSVDATLWENTINVAIFLDNSHRFEEDPQYGAMLDRIRKGEDTIEDRLEINKRVVGSSSSLILPQDDLDISYACATNKQRNAVVAASFRNHIMQTHPDVTDINSHPPDHTLMVEAAISTSGKKQRGRKRKKRNNSNFSGLGQVIQDTIISQLGDDDVRATEFLNRGAKIEPVLRVYPGSHHMCITNENLNEGRGNGTLCKCVKVKLKKNGAERRCKNWDGKKVWTVTVDSVEWIEFVHYPTPPGAKARSFKLTPQSFTATINFPLTQDINVKLGNAIITQIPINANIATTVHKLQGMSKDSLVITEWNYKCANWIYVVLSRVRSLKGLYLLKPLSLEKPFHVPHDLIRFEARMKELKEKPTLNNIIMDRLEQ